MNQTTKKIGRPKIGRPLKLSFSDHVELIRRKRAGENPHVLALEYGVQLHTVYLYVRRDPATRHDAPRGAPPA